MNSPAIIVLTGASGSGKTRLILKLEEHALPGVKVINCDRVDVAVPENTDPSDRQTAVLHYWISQMVQEVGIELAVLDTQIRPHRAQAALAQAGIRHAQIVLVDCEPVKRNERLRLERGQAELANPRMDCWAAYLRGQADALSLSIIDTSNDSIDDSLKMLEALARKLLNQQTAS